MTAAKVLVVEDEDDIRELIKIHLVRNGFDVEEENDGANALVKCKTGKYDLLLLDWMLPGLSGLEITKELRKTKGHEDLSILMVTAKSSDSDTILGLECGADDYLVKPFELSVLLARVRALLRRKEKRDPSHNFSLGALKISTDAHEAKCGDTLLPLTPYEFKLLIALAKHKGRVLTRNQLIQEVQGDGVAVIERAIDTHIFGLRKKMSECADIIETVRGVGYRVSVKP